jgi:hypothetical protein
MKNIITTFTTALLLVTATCALAENPSPTKVQLERINELQGVYQQACEDTKIGKWRIVPPFDFQCNIPRGTSGVLKDMYIVTHTIIVPGYNVGVVQGVPGRSVAGWCYEIWVTRTKEDGFEIVASKKDPLFASKYEKDIYKGTIMPDGTLVQGGPMHFGNEWK